MIDKLKIKRSAVVNRTGGRHHIIEFSARIDKISQQELNNNNWIGLRNYCLI